VPLISSGISNTPILTFCSKDRMLSSSKGKRPVRRAKRMIPHDQISEEDPWYALPCLSVDCLVTGGVTYSNDLGRSVMGTTTTRLEHSLTSLPSCHTEIGDFDILVLVK